MSDEERYFAAQDAGAIENDPAFERGYEAGVSDGKAERSQEVMEYLARLQNNPPGYGGIKVNGEHYGNKYVDMGWIEAVKRVINYVEKGNDESSLSPS